MNKNLNRNQAIIPSIALSILCFLFLFTSCQEADIIDKLEPKPTTLPKYGVYPKAQGATRSDKDGFWEEWNFVVLSNGQSVPTPWNPQFTTATSPSSILRDVYFVDGWDLIFYYLPGEPGIIGGNSPYLIFHNRYTGILKVFYYLTQFGHSPNNHGIWQIHTDEPTGLFAFQNDIISQIPDNKIYNISNITDNATKGFSTGWNCFQIELAYDPNQSGWMNISTKVYNDVKINFSGNLEADSSGLLATSTGNDNFGSGIAKAAGRSAENWVLKKLNDKTILGIPSSYWGSAASAIISGGVGKIIGALTGLFKSDQSSRSLQLTTNGTFTATGDMTFEATTGILPIKFSLDPNYVGYLGVWCLKEEPTLLFSPYAIYNSPQGYTTGYTREYKVDITNSRTANASILINPTLDNDKYIKNKYSSTDFYESANYTRTHIWNREGPVGRPPYLGEKVYDNMYKPNFYMLANVVFLGKENEPMPIDQFEAPIELFIPNVPKGPKGALPNFMYNSRFVASVGVHIILPNGSKAISFHKCIPKIDWDYNEFNNGLYWYLYPCEPLTLTNNGYNSHPIDRLESEMFKLDRNLKDLTDERNKDIKK